MVLAVVAVLVVSFTAAYALLSRTTGKSAEWRGAAEGPQARASAASPSPSAALSPGGSACVTAKLGQLTVQEKAGQVLMIGTSIASPATLADTMRQYHLGGVFLSGHTTLSAATLSQSIASLQGTARVAGDLPVQVALDQEGGEVQSLRGTDFPTIPSAVQQGELSPSALRTQTTDWAQRLAHAGVSLDLAPVADIVPAGTADLNPPIGQLDRQFGSTPAAVAQDVSTVVTAAQAAGVLTTLKHFPGLGRVRENTDKSTKAVDNTTTVTDPSLDPFASGIHAGTAAVMISSATYPKLDPHSIATFSSAIVTGLLRQRLGFTGLIISDDLGAAVAPSIVPAGQRAVRFIQAGGDMVLTVKSSDAGPMVDALVAAAQGSAAFAAQLNEAARQVVASKVRAGLVNCPASG
ncbi:MAG TPA: glycoside hydrolase family 3 N-terminal domain-containing protein [Rugosimonospora sp.]